MIDYIKPIKKELIDELEGPIVVIGASGFIGANLFKIINKFRNDVFACIHSSEGARLIETEQEKIFNIDINDEDSIRRMAHSIKPKVVFNCSSFGAYSFESDKTKIFDTNYLAITKLVNVLKDYPLKAFIHAGSSSEYGYNCDGPQESDICYPNSDYSLSKLAATNFLTNVGKNHNFPCIILRLYSVYGPLEDTSRLIPSIVRCGLENKFPQLVNPDISRDFIYISDVCDAFLKSSTRINQKLYGEVYNIGSERKTTINDIADVAKKEFNITKNPSFGKMKNKKWDLENWYSDSRKAKRDLNWQSTVDLDQGLRLTSDWLISLQNKNGLSKKKTGKSISAIIACYKDELAIPIMYENLKKTFKKLNADYEIIFVNDGSPDNSQDVIKKITKKDNNVIGILHSRNFGSQMAFRSGMEIASKDSVVLLDGDLQDPPELISEFYKKWQEGYEVVYGKRVKRDMSKLWEIQYKLFYRIFALFSYIKIPHDAGDFSLIDKKVVKWLLKFPERDLFLRGLRAYVGFKQIGVDYIRPERRFGKTTNSFYKNIDWAKKGIFSFSNTPLTIMTTSGVILMFISIIVIITVALLRILYPDIAPRGSTTLLIAILSFGSLNLLSIGILGEYIAKILIEVKGRPRLIRRSITKNGEEKNLEK